MIKKIAIILLIILLISCSNKDFIDDLKPIDNNDYSYTCEQLDTNKYYVVYLYKIVSRYEKYEYIFEFKNGEWKMIVFIAEIKNYKWIIEEHKDYFICDGNIKLYYKDKGITWFENEMEWLKTVSDKELYERYNNGKRIAWWNNHYDPFWYNLYVEPSENELKRRGLNYA
jgi:hypothetical protein